MARIEVTSAMATIGWMEGGIPEYSLVSLSYWADNVCPFFQFEQTDGYYVAQVNQVKGYSPSPGLSSPVRLHLPLSCLLLLFADEKKGSGQAKIRLKPGRCT